MVESTNAAANSDNAVSTGTGSVGQVSAAERASAMLANASPGATTDVDTLASGWAAIDPADPARQAIQAEVEARLTPVERGQLAAAMANPANDNVATVYTMQDGTRVAAAADGHAPGGKTLAELRDSPAPADRAVFDSVMATYGSIEAAEAAMFAAPPAALDRPPLEITVNGSGTAVAGGPVADAPAPPPAAPTSSQEGIRSFFQGAIEGDFGNNNSWSATAGQIAAGFVPGLGQAADLRDTAAAIDAMRRGEAGAGWGLAAAAVGWLPGGDLVKGLIRGGDRALGAGDDIAGAVARNADEAAAAARPRIELDGGTTGNWSPELNARTLRPDADYVVNGYTYRTDPNGRVGSVEGRLDLETAQRNGYQQRVAGREDRLPDDQGGHLIASIFNGPGDRLNLVPMDGNFNMGAWRDLERSFQDALTQGKAVDVKIDVAYPEGSARPSTFSVTYTIDGATRVADFDNVPGGGN